MRRPFLAVQSRSRVTATGCIRPLRRHRLLGRRDADVQPQGAARLSGGPDRRLPKRSFHHLAPGSIGPDAASPSGWWNGCSKTRPPWSASTTASPFHSATSRPTTCPPTGPPFWRTSSATGRRMRITPTWTSSATAPSVTATERMGDPRWRRLSEIRARTAKSVFLFDVQGQVAKSTHAGLPWLLYLRRQLGDRVHFWPFDGWQIPTRALRGSGGLPRPLEARLPRGRPHPRPARRLLRRRLAAPSRSRWPTAEILPPRTRAPGARSRRGRRLDSRRWVRRDHGDDQ